MRVLIIGPQGAGKGTQAVVVAGKFGIPHVATGDIFRANVADRTPLGIEAKAFMDSGELVPDTVTNAMVIDRLQQEDAAVGFLLDGYPRNAQQAEVLAEFLSARGERLDAVVQLVIDDDHVLERLSKRALEQGRSDDTAEAIRRRLEIYHSDTKPLIDYYGASGVLHAIDAVGSVEDVTGRILATLSG
jgi:adenylate kinase